METREILGLIGIIVTFIVVTLPFVIYFRRKRKNAVHSFDTLVLPNAPLPRAMSIVPDDLEGYRIIGKFRTLDSYSDYHLGMMVAVLTKAGIPAFWKIAGQSNALLFDVGGSMFELWVEESCIDQAQEVLQRDYFNKS